MEFLTISKGTSIHMLLESRASFLNYFGLLGPGWCHDPREHKRVEKSNYIRKKQWWLVT
jgi:hypothetical protein